MKRTAAGAASILVALTTILLLVTGWIADVAGAAGAVFSQQFEGWLRDHAVMIFWVAIGTAIILAAAIVLLVRDKRHLEGELQSLSGEKITSEESRNRLTVELEKLKRQPSSHDFGLFQRFLSEFPENGETMDYLTQWFHGRNWEWKKLDELSTFNNLWTSNVEFLDSEMQYLLQDLQQKSAIFLSEIAGNSFMDNAYEEVTALRHDQFENDGEFNHKADALQKLGDEVAAAHKKLVRMGYERRLA
ncbi:hypothetical protein HH310_42185 [Actinoplanes sp. TBRC 11911]|uniref:hypothetical protein n=1 Tax=Actinoplanes sp. TBRC 11911 TaxID=2729386 RepID=UPI00145D2B71|nr:hypothetical protein [Actinoplanes sp. TBRC 11911]NMO57760.1 hypothetical protein [Actinoplanes sp. TBRC 11911]